MTLQQIEDIRKISNKGIYSISIKKQLSNYCKENNLKSKDVIRVCQEDFSVEDLFRMLNKD